MPSIAAVSRERNQKANEDVNVKPTLHDRFSSKFYVPGKYLNPYGGHNSSFAKKLKPETNSRVDGDIQYNTNNKAYIAHVPIEKKYQSMNMKMGNSQNDNGKTNQYTSNSNVSLFKPRETKT